MVTVSVSAPRQDSLLTTASLVRTILVVEHDPYQAESFTQHFSFKAHHYAKLVTSAAAALNFVKHIKPNLFLLEYHLPDMDGLSLYDLLQETRGLASTPAIIVGVPLPKQALAVIKTQQLVLLSTPIDLEELGHDIFDVIHFSFLVYIIPQSFDFYKIYRKFYFSFFIVKLGEN